MPKEVLIPIVTVAIPVVWLQQGMIKSARPALVDKVGMNGVYDLQVFSAGGGSPRLQRSVRHLDDPFFSGNQAELARTGAWLTPKQYDARRAVEAEHEASLIRAREAQQLAVQTDRIVKLAEAGTPVSVIAAQMGVAPHLVEDVLDARNVKVGVLQKSNEQKPEPATV